MKHLFLVAGFLLTLLILPPDASADGSGPKMCVDGCGGQCRHLRSAKCPLEICADFCHVECTLPDCARTTCFEQQQAWYQSAGQATGPGVVALLAAPFGGGPGPAPEVAMLDRIPREPTNMGKYSCPGVLTALGKADEQLASMGELNQHQDQQAVMSCLQDFCRKNGWPTQ